MATAFLDLVKKGTAADVRDALIMSPALANCAGWRDYSPLHCACMAGNVEVAKILLEFGAFLESRTSSMETPLLLACQNGSVPLVSLLLASTADTQAVDDTGAGPMWRAASNNNVQLLHYLHTYFGLSYSASNAKGQNLLHAACLQGRLEAVRYLLRSGRVLPLLTDHQQHTPLDLCILYRYIDVARYLFAVAPSLNLETANALLSQSKCQPSLRCAFERLLASTPPVTTPTDISKDLQWIITAIPFVYVAVLLLAAMYLPYIAQCAFVGAVGFFFYDLRRLAKVLPLRLFEAITVNQHHFDHMGFFLASCIYSAAFFFVVLAPNVQTIAQLICALTLSVLGIYTTLLFWRLMHTDPGLLGRAQSSSKVDAKSFENSPFCVTCEICRPSRSKHCRVCDHCVAMFDHHCHWLNLDISLTNHRAFIQFLLFLICTQVCLVTMMLLTVPKPLHISAIYFQHPIGVWIFLLNFLVLIPEAQLCYSQLDHVSIGLTTNEILNHPRYGIVLPTLSVSEKLRRIFAYLFADEAKTLHIVGECV